MLLSRGCLFMARSDGGRCSSSNSIYSKALPAAVVYRSLPTIYLPTYLLLGRGRDLEEAYVCVDVWMIITSRTEERLRRGGMPSILITRSNVLCIVHLVHCSDCDRHWTLARAAAAQLLQSIPLLPLWRLLQQLSDTPETRIFVYLSLN